MTTQQTTTNKILITDGAGFIGSNLVDHFLQYGHNVVQANENLYLY